MIETDQKHTDQKWTIPAEPNPANPLNSEQIHILSAKFGTEKSNRYSSYAYCLYFVNYIFFLLLFLQNTLW